MEIPIVSVCMITYNHEHFIAEALGGILDQKTSFPFELIISNDASSDKTHQKIIQLTKELPNHISLKYFNHEQNIGMIPNVVFSLKQCRGKYIAFCEGDDYWIDINKLEGQVGFLEKHPEFNLITGAAKRYNQNKRELLESKRKNDYSFTYMDMIERNHCPTCATTFRNYILGSDDFSLYNDKGIDSQIWIRALEKEGLGKFVGKPVAVYRKHDGGASNLMHKKSFDSFENRMAYLERKISKAEFWNNFYGGEATDRVFKVKTKIIRPMIRLAKNEKKMFLLSILLGRYLYYNFRLLTIKR